MPTVVDGQRAGCRVPDVVANQLLSTWSMAQVTWRRRNQYINQ